MRACARVPFALLGLLAACHARPDPSKKPTRACREAEESLDRAIAIHDFARARSLRAGVYSTCGLRAELRARDQRIVDGEVAALTKELVKRRAEQELADALHVFLGFVSEHRASPELASIHPSCDDAPHDTTPNGVAPPARFCVAKRSIGDRYPIELRYDRDDPRAFRFSLYVGGAVDCAQVGGTLEQTWRVAQPGGGSVERTSCRLGAALSGLGAVVSASSPSSVHIVSPSYLERDPGARGALAPPAR